MKDVVDIFIVNEEGVLEINKPEVRDIKEFKAIITRDKGGKVHGDYDGRNKLFAFKELRYIYLYVNPGSIYRDLPDEVKHEKCVETAELPEKWKVDKVIRDAMEKYSELINLSALHHSYINANKAVYSLGEDLKFFNQLRDKLRGVIIGKTKELENETLEENIQVIEATIDHATNRLMDIGVKINNISNNLPVAFDTVEKLKQKLLKESQGGGAIYGGGDLHNRER